MSEALGVSILGGASVVAIVLGLVDALAAGSRRRRARLARFVHGVDGGMYATGRTASAPLVRPLAALGRTPARWLGLAPSADSERLLDAAGRPTGIDAAGLMNARVGASIVSWISRSDIEDLHKSRNGWAQDHDEQRGEDEQDHREQHLYRRLSRGLFCALTLCGPHL